MANMVKGLLMLCVCAAEAKEEAKVDELAAGAAATVRYDKHHSKGFYSPIVIIYYHECCDVSKFNNFSIKLNNNIKI